MVIVSMPERQTEIRNFGGCRAVIKLGAVSLSVWRGTRGGGETDGERVSLGYFRAFRGSMAAEHAKRREKA